MAKHSKSQGQASSKPKQRTKKSRSERICHELTAQPSSSDDQRHQIDTIMQSEARPISPEQTDQGIQSFYPDSRTVEGRWVEDDLASASHERSFDDANSFFEAPEQELQGPVDGLLSASAFENDLRVFDHLGAHIPTAIHFDAQSTGYTSPQWSWEPPVTATQTIALSTPSSYNASTAVINYQSTCDSPTKTVYSHPTTTTLDTLPVSTQYQLERWVYENGRDEATLADQMERYNYNL
ncbi:hypothetical protein BOTCAL_0025g00110 [Botryotinia calthae]|uniref:Uncharacterized protein n=1 Tax=Botryotinia calthae TaxID=38488 RepID=A0A4Y8DED5_9HELO|nr:hypothetical protein BOTCAL_0025g00110 [Botryotinia calthae]